MAKWSPIWDDKTLTPRQRQAAIDKAASKPPAPVRPRDRGVSPCQGGRFHRPSAAKS